MADLAVVGSIADLAHHHNTRIANVLMDVEHLIVVDCSGSMDAHDARDGERTRFEAACAELRKLQRQYQGKIAVIGFSDEVQFSPGGLPEPMHGGTDLTAALEYIQDFDGTGVTFDVISDGIPDDQTSALAVAQRLTTRINTIYIGPTHGEDWVKQAMAFMKRLAAVSGGASVVNSASDIGSAVTRLLEAKR